jgi:hypothetical protein
MGTSQKLLLFTYENAQARASELVREQIVIKDGCRAVPCGTRFIATL